jgi:hypothetical protein
MSEEERITTYSGPRQGPPEEVRELRHGVHREGEGLREAFRLITEPVEVKRRIWRGRVGAADGGSAILPFADRDVSFIATITVTVVDDGRSYHRRFRSTLTSLSSERKKASGKSSKNLFKIFT